MNKKEIAQSVADDYYQNLIIHVAKAVEKGIEMYQEEVKKIIDKHTIKNMDGEEYIACDPYFLTKEIELEKD